MQPLPGLSVGFPPGLSVVLDDEVLALAGANCWQKVHKGPTDLNSEASTNGADVQSDSGEESDKSVSTDTSSLRPDAPCFVPGGGGSSGFAPNAASFLSQLSLPVKVPVPVACELTLNEHMIEEFSPTRHSRSSNPGQRNPFPPRTDPTRSPSCMPVWFLPAWIVAQLWPM